MHQTWALATKMCKQLQERFYSGFCGNGRAEGPAIRPGLGEPLPHWGNCSKKDVEQTQILTTAKKAIY